MTDSIQYFITLLGAVILAVGMLFTMLAAVGILRFPDFYTRLHASGKCETLGVAAGCLGIAMLNGFNLTSLKVIFVCVIIMLINPVGTHVISRAAYRGNLRPWTKADRTSTAEKEAQE